MRTVEKRETDKRLCIAHVVMSHYIGGLERMVVSLIRGTDREKYRLVLCCIEREGEWVREVSDVCDAVVVMDKKPGLAYGLPFRFARFFHAQHIDLVHCHNFGAYLYGAVGARLARCRAIVYTLHGPDVPSDRTRILLHQLPLAHRVVTVSDHMRRNAIERVRIDPQRVVTIVNGVDVERPDEYSDGRRIRAEIGVGEDKPLLGCVARLTPEKDHATLLRGFARMGLLCPDAILLIVGDGPLRDKLEKLASELHLSQSVRFLGTRQDVSDILAALDAFVLTSTDEGLPVALLEAMAAGLPVVATSVGGMPDAVLDGVTGLLIPPSNPQKAADAMIELITDKERAKKMGDKAKERVAERFGVSQMIHAYQDLYTGLLCEKRRHSVRH